MINKIKTLKTRLYDNALFKDEIITEARKGDIISIPGKGSGWEVINGRSRLAKSGGVEYKYSNKNITIVRSASIEKKNKKKSQPVQQTKQPQKSTSIQSVKRVSVKKGQRIKIGRNTWEILNGRTGMAARVIKGEVTDKTKKFSKSELSGSTLLQQKKSKTKSQIKSKVNKLKNKSGKTTEKSSIDTTTLLPSKWKKDGVPAESFKSIYGSLPDKADSDLESKDSFVKRVIKDIGVEKSEEAVKSLFSEVSINIHDKIKQSKKNGEGVKKSFVKNLFAGKEEKVLNDTMKLLGYLGTIRPQTIKNIERVMSKQIKESFNMEQLATYNKLKESINYENGLYMFIDKIIKTNDSNVLHENITKSLHVLALEGLVSKNLLS